MHHRDVKSVSVHGGRFFLLPPQPAETSPGMGALKWEHRPFHLPTFSLSAPLLATVLERGWEEKGEGEERPPRKADGDGAVLIGGEPGSISELGRRVQTVKQ